MLLAVETIQGDLYVNVKQCESSGEAGGLALGIVNPRINIRSVAIILDDKDGY